MDRKAALIAEAAAHVAVYDFDLLEASTWPKTMRDLVDLIEAQDRALVEVKGRLSRARKDLDDIAGIAGRARSGISDHPLATYWANRKMEFMAAREVPAAVKGGE